MRNITVCKVRQFLGNSEIVFRVDLNEKIRLNPFLSLGFTDSFNRIAGKDFAKSEDKKG